MPKADYTGGASGLVQGAATGYQFAGPLGAVGGGILGLTGGLFGSGKKKKKKRSTLDKKQQKLNDQQYDALIGQGPLADLYSYNPEMANKVFDENYANPAYKKFQEDLAPKITGNFRSMGLQNSSYVGDALTKLAYDIQSGLDAKRSEYLYSKEQDAQSAKRSAVENLQNRQTFAYDTAAPTNSGFDFNRVLDTITPENINTFKDWYKSSQKPKTGVI